MSTGSDVSAYASPSMVATGRASSRMCTYLIASFKLEDEIIGVSPGSEDEAPLCVSMPPTTTSVYLTSRRKCPSKRTKGEDEEFIDDGFPQAGVSARFCKCLRGVHPSAKD